MREVLHTQGHPLTFGWSNRPRSLCPVRRYHPTLPAGTRNVPTGVDWHVSNPCVVPPRHPVTAVSSIPSYGTTLRVLEPPSSYLSGPAYLGYNPSILGGRIRT